MVLVEGRFAGIVAFEIAATNLQLGGCGKQQHPTGAPRWTITICECGRGRSAYDAGIAMRCHIRQVTAVNFVVNVRNDKITSTCSGKPSSVRKPPLPFGPRGVNLESFRGVHILPGPERLSRGLEVEAITQHDEREHVAALGVTAETVESTTL